MPRGSRFGALALACVAFAAGAGFGCSSSPTKGDDSPTPPDSSVFDSCVEFASRLCADAAGCCQQVYDGFDQEACVDDFKREVCQPGASAVKAGKAAFNAEAIEGCLAAHAEAHAVCVPSWAETLELRKRIYTECRVIDGIAAPGSACALPANCKRPPGAATAECVKNVCVTVEILGKGAECPFPSGSVSVCDEGLTCDAAGAGELGHCIDAITAGAACDGSVLESTECGLGSFCDPQSSTCKLTTNMGGSGCQQSTECVSFECDRLADDCATAPAVISRTTCLGNPATP